MQGEGQLAHLGTRRYHLLASAFQGLAGSVSGKRPLWGATEPNAWGPF